MSIKWGRAGDTACPAATLRQIMLTETVDCPLCAGSDVVAIESGQFFCPWCLYEWEADASLILDSTVDEADFLANLTAAFNQAA